MSVGPHPWDALGIQVPYVLDALCHNPATLLSPAKHSHKRQIYWPDGKGGLVKQASHTPICDCPGNGYFPSKDLIFM